ncbi:MAG: TIM-barrel domain-containing protein [Candidatus Eisenbacteria bacterium]
MPRYLAFPLLPAFLAIGALALFAPDAPAQIVAESIGDRMVRFYRDEEARANAVPSIALVRPRPSLGASPADFPIAPLFQNIQNRNGVRVRLPQGTSYYGTGEVPGPLLRNGRKTTLWNFDAYGYGDETPHLYQSHPWVLGVRPDGSAFGLLFDTTWRSHIDLTGDILFVSEGPPFAVIAVDRPTPQEVVMALADLTGTMPLPPKWAIGYHQCRYSYYPDSRVREIARGFRERHIPCDVIWLDIDYMDGFRCFTFHPDRFPDPVGLNEDLHDLGFRTVWMIDPGIKRESGYFVYDSGTAEDVWVKRADGRTYTGKVWPGECVFPDFLNRKVREWWGGLHAGFLAAGVDGVWNDMNEPAVFDVPGKTMPPDNVHDADDGLGGPDRHERYHNVYGMQMVRATREGILRAYPERRPFVLSRANHLGGHRYAATWSGDNWANWYHLDASIPMTLNLGLSGQPFSGPDIGGFGGGGDGRLFARWMGIGALLPFARGHSEKGPIDKEPWSFGPEVEETCRKALERRYVLMPYLYTLFREASVTGLPVARPLFFADPADPDLREEDDSFLLGRDLLVACRTSSRLGAPPALPKGDWRPLDLGVGAAGDRDLPDLFLRGGAIVPAGPVIEHLGEATEEELTLLVRLDRTGRAEGFLYEDDGESFAYRYGAYRLTKFSAERRGDYVHVGRAIMEGTWKAPRRTITVRVLLDKGEKTAVWKGSEGMAIPLIP